MFKIQEVNWGIIGCGNVTELKSGPAFNKTEHSRLVAVMRRNAVMAEDYAKRHNVPKFYADASLLINDPEVNAIYIATPPNTHASYAIQAMRAGKPVYVEKPMALNYKECQEMIRISEETGMPLFVAYYRRTLPAFLKAKELIDNGIIGKPLTVNVRLHKSSGEKDRFPEKQSWHINPEIAGAGYFYDLASHQFDYLDFVFGPITEVHGVAKNIAGFYPAEDTVSAAFAFDSGVNGTGSWCFVVPKGTEEDIIEITGTKGKLTFSSFQHGDVKLTTPEGTVSFSFQNPENIQHNLIAQVVKTLRGESECVSTGKSAARTSKILEKIVKEYYKQPISRLPGTWNLKLGTMKIVIDDKIPYIRGAFEGVAEVVYLAGSKTTPEVVKDADAIVTRTRTICNEKLLAGSSVKFIATATIGYDHIDTDYCDVAGIKWTNAPGCNSKSVEQYIASTLMVLAERKNLQLKDLTIGVVGVGNVGSKVARISELFGMKVLKNDPPRERAEGSAKFVSLEQVMEEADIITLHVPLNMKGEDATFHLGNDEFFSGLKKKPVVINSCRGEVVDTLAVKAALKSNQISGFVCDCWENEPDLDLELLAMTEIATPHIAGYSKDGKATGTEMSVHTISNYFDLGLESWQPSGVEQPANPFFELDGAGLSEQEIISKAILHTYDIRNDDANFRKNTAQFEQLRGDYPTRREFPAFTVVPKNIGEETLEVLRKIGFKIN